MQEEHIEKLLDQCKINYAKGMSSPELPFTKDDVTVDCDGFSIIISVHDESPSDGGTKSMSSRSRDAIHDIMKVFGTRYSAVTLPSKPNAMKLPGAAHQANDHMFGGKDVRLMEGPGKQCLMENEILVIDAPVKIAVHQDCAANICNGVNSLNYPCEVSTKKGICLKPVGTMPAFGEMLDVILDSCYVPEAKRWIIHLGGVGGRIRVDHRSSFLQDLFEKISHARTACNRGFNVDTQVGSGMITIEVAQLDLALNVPIRDGNLIRWGINSHNKCLIGDEDYFNNHFSCLTGCETKVWALHKVESGDGKILKDKNQMGTVRYKHKHSNVSSTEDDVLSTEDDVSKTEDVLSENDPDKRPKKKRKKSNIARFDVITQDNITESDKLLRGIYKVQIDDDQCSYDQRCDFFDDLDLIDEQITNSVMPQPNLQEFKEIISNVKMYSTIAHGLLRERFAFPLWINQINSAPQCSFIQLKRMLDKFKGACNKTFAMVDQYGLKARAEVSFRPMAESSNLRSEGHLVDFLSLFCRVVDERFVVNPSLFISTVSTGTVYEEVMRNIGNVQSLLKHRNSDLFCDKYPSGSCWLWLKASICHIMTLMGLAHHARQTHLRAFVQNSERFDPFKLAAYITRENEDEVMSDDEEKTQRIRDTMSKLLSDNNISEAALPVLLEYSCKTTPCSRKEMRECISQLSLVDMINLAYCLPKIIIPEILQALIPHDHTPGSLGDEGDAGGESEEFLFNSELDNNDYARQMDMIKFFDPTRGFNEKMLHSYNMMNFGDPPIEMKYYLQKNCEIPDSCCNPILVMLFNLNELHSMLSEDTPSFFDKLVMFVNRCHELRVMVPGSESCLDALESEFCPRSCRRRGMVSISTLLKEVEKLPMTSGSSTNQDLLRDIATFYGFPCKCDTPPDTNYIELCKRSNGLNDVIQMVHNMTFVSELVPLRSDRFSGSSKSRRYYLESTNSILDIPKKESVMKVDMTFPSVIAKSEKAISHNRIEEAVWAKYEEYLQDNFALMTAQLSKVSSLCDTMIDDRGNIMRDFLPFLDFDTILSKRGLGEEDTMFYQKYILPLLTLILKNNVLVVDRQNKMSRLHVFHERPNLVVTYMHSGDTIVRPSLPKSKCDVFFITQTGSVVVIDIDPAAHNTIQRPRIDFKEGQPASWRSRSGIVNKLTFPLCLASHLSSDIYNHPDFAHLRGRTRWSRQMDDPLRIKTFLIELVRHQSQLEEWFDKTILDCLCHLGINSFSDIQSRLFQNDDDDASLESLEPDQEAFLSLVVSTLKYKLFIVCYLDGDNIFPCSGSQRECPSQMTRVFFFNQISSKLTMISRDGFYHVENADHFIYSAIKRDRNNQLKFQYWSQVSKYLFPIQKRYYYNLLRFRCAYMNDFVFKDIIKQFKTTLGMDFHHFEEIGIAACIQVKEDSPFITICMSQTHITHLQYFPLIIFKSDDKLWCKIVVQTELAQGNNDATVAAREDFSVMVKEELHSLYELLHENCRHEIHFQILFISDFDICSRSVCLALAYIAHNSNIVGFANELLKLSKDKIGMWKKWLCEFTLSYGHPQQSFIL